MKILIADDHDLVRDMLSLYLAQEPGLPTLRRRESTWQVQFSSLDPSLLVVLTRHRPTGSVRTLPARQWEHGGCRAPCSPLAGSGRMPIFRALR